MITWSQTAGSGNRRADFVSSLLLQIKQIRLVVCQFRYQPIPESLLHYKSQKGFLAGKAGELAAMYINGLCAINSLQGATHWHEKPQLVVLSRRNCFLWFKERDPFRRENKIPAVQRYMNAYWLILPLTPVKSCWTIPLKKFATNQINCAHSLTSSSKNIMMYNLNS
jgi:hypothetical protein